MWRARFLCQIFAANVFNRIFLERDGRVAALLRAVVHQPIFANIEIPCPSPAAPLVRLAQGNIVLEGIDAREAPLFERFHLVIHAALVVHKRLELAIAIMTVADG